MTDRRRKGSLGWYHNSSRGSLVPKTEKKVGLFGIKVGCSSRVVDEILTPVSLIELVNFEKKEVNKYEVDYTHLKCVRKKVLRTMKSTEDPQTIKDSILSTSYLNVVGLSKGKGTLGVVQRRNVKMQKRKAAKSGVTRKGGSHGLRIPGKVVWTKPFSGKTGFSRRTIQNLKNVGTQSFKEVSFLRYYIKDSTVLLVKGAIPGSIGRPLFIYPSKKK